MNEKTTKTTEYEVENEMRIILNDEIFLNERYLSLTKQETDKLFKIIALFASEDKEYLDLSFICSNFDVSEEFKVNTSFCINYSEKCKIIKYFSWFKGHRSSMERSRSKNKGESKMNSNLKDVINVEQEVVDSLIGHKETEEPKKQDNVNYKKIIDIFNSTFKGSKVPSIKILNDKRRNMIKKLYKDMKSSLEEEVDIYEFYEAYFSMISDDKNLTSGWPYSQAKNGWFNPDIDYFLKDKCFIKLVENK